MCGVLCGEREGGKNGREMGVAHAEGVVPVGCFAFLGERVDVGTETGGSGGDSHRGPSSLKEEERGRREMKEGR